MKPRTTGLAVALQTRGSTSEGKRGQTQWMEVNKQGRGGKGMAKEKVRKGF